MTNIEIDVLIADKIMGWQVMKLKYPDDVELFILEKQAYIKALHFRSNCVPYWRPSIDPKAALEVVEKLREMGWLITVQAIPGGLTLPESKKPVPAYMVAAAYIKGRDSADPVEIEKYICFRPYGSGETVSEAVCRMVVEMIHRGIFERNVRHEERKRNLVV